MLRNYLSIAIRHLARQRLYSAINIIGLSIGLASCVLILLFVNYELSYDRQFSNADRIYRISRDFFPSDEDPFEMHLAPNAPQVAPLMKADFPQIEEAARIYCCGNILVSSPDSTLYDEGIALADSEIFEIFDFDWLRGDPAGSLVEPYTIVLTEASAQRFFGDADPMGETLLIENQWPVRVVGVIRTLPENTHLRFNSLVSLPTLTAVSGPEELTNWSSNNFYTYVLLREGADIADIENQSDAFFERHSGEGDSQHTGYSATALTDIHLRSHRDAEMSTPGSLTTLYTMGAIAAFILLIACINFMNLSTARSAQRAKEVGVRKVVGAERSQLVQQFLGESIFLSIVAAILAMSLVEISLPFFSSYLQRPLVLDYFSNPLTLPTLVLLAVVTGLLAGSYPAFYLSAFRPARVLKGDVTRGNAAATFRKILVVLQFSISVVLIIGTLTVFEQMRFAQNIDLGFNKDQIVILNTGPTAGLGSQWSALKERLLAHPEITHVTASNLVPSEPNLNSITVQIEGGASVDLPNLRVDFDFFETYQMQPLTGRLFSEEFGTDKQQPPTDGSAWSTATFILNELAARQLGWTPSEAIGKLLRVPTGPGEGINGPVVGVVGNAHFESVHNAIRPMIFRVPRDRINNFWALRSASIKITGQNIADTLQYIDEQWALFNPDQPISRHFLDDDFAALYLAEERQAQILGIFSILAVFIACLGLFALASFTTESRTKEIGIRKALGAGVWNIVRLFATETSWLVLLANVIAWPVAFIAMQRWLENFAYRIDMSLAIYFGSAIAALTISWLTVAGVAAKAANDSPTLALRYE